MVQDAEWRSCPQQIIRRKNNEKWTAWWWKSGHKVNNLFDTVYDLLNIEFNILYILCAKRHSNHSTRHTKRGEIFGYVCDHVSNRITTLSDAKRGSAFSIPLRSVQRCCNDSDKTIYYDQKCYNFGFSLVFAPNSHFIFFCLPCCYFWFHTLFIN